MRTLRTWFIVLMLGFALVATTGSITQVTPPSGKYRHANGDLSLYNNVTGNLTSDGSTELVCIVDAEQRINLAGVCVDIDVEGNGYDAMGYLTLVGEWELSYSIKVNGNSQPVCSPACYADNVAGITYFSFQIDGSPCGSYPPGSQLTAVVKIKARLNADNILSSTDSVTFTCPS